MKENQTICQFLNIKVYPNKPFEIKHSGKLVYYEDSTGYWYKREFDSSGNVIYFESSSGYWYKREFDSSGNVIYFESSSGYWYKQEYDSNGNLIYYETSNGKIIDNRVKELTLEEIAEKFGIPVSQLKIKK